MENDEFNRLLERLTGEPVPFADTASKLPPLPLSLLEGLGHSQLNELLLLCGLDRVTTWFFAYLLTGKPMYKPGMVFTSEADLTAGVERFRKTALLLYGNVKYAFKSLSQDPDLLISDLAAVAPRDEMPFKLRHAPTLPLVDIAPDAAYLTGYLIEGQVKARLHENPEDPAALEMKAQRDEAVQKSLINQSAYLASDHLDVYVATSMRAKHEFISVHRTVKAIFGQDPLAELKLRWFDPTQAYCMNRVDKGLAEALMLKRATCTIYLAQEADTLGKDSELASTLAQGKPVIAFIPEVDESYLEAHFAALREAEPDRPEADLLLDQLKLIEPGAAWDDDTVKRWCSAPAEVPIDQVKNRLKMKLKSHYDKRATTLRDTHPLGIQVNLATGVANGVLVVRTVSECARLVKAIITGTLEFDLVEGPDNTALRETISQSIFRVMTHDAMLTNTFWNFYLNPAE